MLFIEIPDWATIDLKSGREPGFCRQNLKKVFRVFVLKRYIIPIFIPHQGCSHRCVFCDQKTIAGIAGVVSGEDVAAEIAVHLPRITRPRYREVAFYGGSFTSLSAERQSELLAPATAALKNGDIQAIRVSTRPDSIDRPALSRLTDFGVTTVEIGVQSLDDIVLTMAGRGHTAADVDHAVGLLREFGLQCGLQLMPGLPGENWLSLIHTANGVIALRPDFVRIYPTVVIAGTRLQELYSSGEFKPLSLPEAVAKTAYLKLLFDNEEIPVIRLGLQATKELSALGKVVAGPYHPAFGEMVSSFGYRLMVARFFDGIFPRSPAKITILHHPKDHSKLRGIGGANLGAWRKLYPGTTFSLFPDWSCQGEIAIVYAGTCYVANTKMIDNC